MNWSQDNLRLPSIKKGRQHVAIAVGISFALHAVLIAAAGSLLAPEGGGKGWDTNVMVVGLVELSESKVVETEDRSQEKEVRNQKTEDRSQSFDLVQDPERAEGKSELEKQAPVPSPQLTSLSRLGRDLRQTNSLASTRQVGVTSTEFTSTPRYLDTSIQSSDRVPTSTEHKMRTPTHEGTQIAMAGNGVATGLLGGSTFSQISIIDLPRPVYPGRSRRRGEEGRVVLSVRIGVDGQVINASIDTSSNYQRLDLAAVKAIGRGTFRPAMINGEFIESTCKVAYTFRLEGDR